MGLLSIVSADADEIPAAPAASASSPAAEPEILTPPPLLPWGAVPEELEVAKPGTSSDKLADIGADAAPDDSAHSSYDVDDATKGMLSGSSKLTSTAAPVPPMPPGRVKVGPEPGEKIDFHYAALSQEAATTGAYASMIIATPMVGERDAHSLAEISVQLDAPGGRQQHIVEFGWHVDPVIYGDNNAHMFVFHWIDGVPKCYNDLPFDCQGFVQIDPKVRPGFTLPVLDPDNPEAKPKPKMFGILRSGKAWWVAYESAYIGYFPDTLWGGRFTQSNNVQFFGEVAASAASKPLCTQMGNGLPAWDEDAARIGSIQLVNGPPLDLKIKSESPAFSLQRLGTRTFRYGGGPREGSSCFK